MSRLIRAAAIGWLLSGIIACGSDDDDEGSGGQNPEALASCNQFCDASAGKSCQLLSAADCKQICSALMQSIDASCAAKQKASYDCQLAQPDVCDSSQCQTQMQEANACLGS